MTWKEWDRWQNDHKERGGVHNEQYSDDVIWSLSSLSQVACQGVGLPDWTQMCADLQQMGKSLAKWVKMYWKDIKFKAAK